MKVKFLQNWFAPSDAFDVGERSLSGVRYRRGHVYDIPYELVEYLPSSAEILDAEYSAPLEKEKSLKDFDEARVEDPRAKYAFNKESAAKGLSARKRIASKEFAKEVEEALNQ